MLLVAETAWGLLQGLPCLSVGSEEVTQLPEVTAPRSQPRGQGQGECGTPGHGN